MQSTDFLQLTIESNTRTIRNRGVADQFYGIIPILFSSKIPNLHIKLKLIKTGTSVMISNRFSSRFGQIKDLKAQNSYLREI
jgi:hypothetical protein